MNGYPAGGGLVSSRIERYFSAGESVVIVVDGYNGSAGSYQLNITAGASPTDAGFPTCPAGQLLCSGRCVSVLTDTLNCGACGLSCPTGQRCNSGRCESTTPRWTIFVYGHADHNLSPALLEDIIEMSRASLGGYLNVIVYTDWDGGKAMSSRQRTDWNRMMPIPAGAGGLFPSSTHWLRINGDGRSPTLLRTDPERNLDDPNVLAEAVRTTLSMYPADRYGVILWDHGGSWQGGYGGDTQNNTLRYANQTPMRASVVAGALRAGLASAGISRPRPLDFVAFDTCLLGAAETAYPFRDLAQVFIGEAELDFGDGWDYRAAFNLLSTNPSRTAPDFARAEMFTWAAHHAGLPGSNDALIRSRVALDLTRIDAFAASARGLVDTLLVDPMMASPAIARAAMRSTPVYSPSLLPTAGSEAYRDLGQFLDALLTLPLSTASRNAAQSLSSSLDALIIARDQGSLRALARQRGLQIALPEWSYFDSTLESTYRSAAGDWSSATRWSDLVRGLNPGFLAPPTVSPFWSNVTGGHNGARPNVYFETTGEVNRALISVYRYDPSAPNPSYPWRLGGIVATGNIDPRLGYRYSWDGMQVELPDGQAVPLIPFIAAANVGMMTEFQTEAAIGSCSVPGWNPFSCALVWDRASMTATSVIDITNPSSPSFLSLEEISIDGLAEFRPALYYESSTQQSLAYYGRPYLLPSSGRLTMRRSRSPAGTFEFRVAVRDVYGRAVNQAQIVTTAAPYGP